VPAWNERKDPHSWVGRHGRPRAPQNCSLYVAMRLLSYCTPHKVTFRRESKARLPTITKESEWIIDGYLQDLARSVQVQTRRPMLSPPVCAIPNGLCKKPNEWAASPSFRPLPADLRNGTKNAIRLREPFKEHPEEVTIRRYSESPS
jgi:hypothetical protein